jgi:hypothetical protein
MADHEIHYPELAEFLAGRQLQIAMQGLVDAMHAEAVATAPRRTGKLARQGIRKKVFLQDGTWHGKLSLKGPWNTLSTRNGLRRQVEAWGHLLMTPIMHPARNRFLQRSLTAVPEALLAEEHLHG